MVKIRAKRRRKKKRQPKLWLLILTALSGALVYAYRQNYFDFKDLIDEYVLSKIDLPEGIFGETYEPITVGPDFTPDEKFGLPAFSGNDMIIQHQYYVLCYDEEHEQAKWVAYKLTKRSIKGRAEREDDFRPDPKVPTESASPNDYRGSDYDRGHLAPAADFKLNKTAMSETFFMSNMSPQDPEFNRGVWRILEEKIRDWVYNDDELYVVVGPVLKGGGFEKIGRNKVSVPAYYYKILLDFEEPEIKAIAFLMKNEDTNKSPKYFAVSIDEVEEATGLDFFPSLPDDVEEKLESQVRKSQWF